MTVAADDEEEPHETFFVELSEIGSDGCDSAEPETCPLPFDGLAVGTILTDEFCQRGLGYWKNRTDEWPVDRLVLGGIECESAGLLERDQGRFHSALHDSGDRHCASLTGHRDHRRAGARQSR